MPETRAASLSPRAYAYIFGVIALGGIAIAHSAYVLTVKPVSGQWLVLAALTLLTGSFSVKIPSVAARISVSDAFVFTAVLLFGAAPATIIVALDSVILSLWQRADERHGLRSAFNLTAAALALWTSATFFFVLAHATPGRVDELLPLENHLVELFVFACTYFLVNSWLVAIALGFEKNSSPVTVWHEHFPWFIVNYVGGISVAALLVSYSKAVDLRAVGIILPLLVISFLTYRTSLGRMADAKRHVEQLSSMYLATIEALAMAVDAKDQITHGHIRRVQVYALELAKRLGVREEQQLKAIEAAALLHDMGKLAIPEHILNKPGKLTPSEFERMKQHAALGADLLSSISFPYPVVPIVRHHHEQWDGRGYPSGISGTDIPLGARILSVVDCFDALTSDRPYRPRLSNSDAFRTLMDRRGGMYDPLVVDTFVRTHSEIEPVAMRAGQEARSLYSHFDPALSDRSPLDQIRSNVTATAHFRDCEMRLASASRNDLLAVASDYLRQTTPARVFALFSYDPHTDLLTCGEAAGDPHGLLVGLTIHPGQRISGWCAANRRTSLNSNAVLDLHAIAAMFEPALMSAISAPIVRGNTLLGVLSVYASREEAFTDEHGLAVEQVAASLAQRLTVPERSEKVVLRFGQ